MLQCSLLYEYMQLLVGTVSCMENGRLPDIILNLVVNELTWQSSCVIANNTQKTAKAICARL